MALQHLRSSTADKRPDPTAMSDGQLAINTNSTSPGLFYKNSAGALVKAGPTHVGTTAPNATPASGGTSGNSVGETWLDTSGANPVLKVWDGSAWQAAQAASGGTVTSVDVAGGTGLTSSGGPITSSGTITVDLDNTAVTPGSYTYASITVDQQGRLTAASNGTTPLTSSDIGVTVQGYDADTAKLDTAQTFTAAQTFSSDLTLNAQSDLRFADADSSNWVAFQAPATVASNVTWTLPDADGTSGQVLSTDGTGALSWATAAGGASVTTSDTAPSSPSDGDLWYDSVGGRTYVYYQDPNGSQWVDASPQGGGASLWTQGTGVLIPATSTDLVQVNGIKFPATQVASADANTLDDYEEGTWTPVVSDAASGGNIASAATRVGTYTKVGRLVTVSFRVLSLNTSGLTGSNFLYLQSLPFAAVTANGVPEYWGSVNFTNVTFPSSTNDLTSKVDGGTASIYFNVSRSGTSRDALTVSAFASGTSHIFGTLSYQAS